MNDEINYEKLEGYQLRLMTLMQRLLNEALQEETEGAAEPVDLDHDAERGVWIVSGSPYALTVAIAALERDARWTATEWYNHPENPALMCCEIKSASETA